MSARGRQLHARLVRRLLWASAATVSLAAAVEGAEPAPCFAAASLDPPRAVVGEPLLYRVRIARRPEVISATLDPPNFSSLRAEWLEGRPEVEEIHDGRAYRIREEHIALFAGTPLRNTLEHGAVRCTTLREGMRQTLLVPVSPIPLSVFTLPAAGQPARFAGLVGAPTLIVTVSPRKVPLGETVRVAVLMRGNGNLWDARDPLPALENAEVFRQRPVLRLDRGATLSVARHFIYDVVPREQGRLVIPEIAVPYFDPTTNSYSESRAEKTEIEVAPRRPLPSQE